MDVVVYHGYSDLYLDDRGVHDDLPLPDLLDTFRSVYGEGLFAGPQARNADAFTPPA